MNSSLRVDFLISGWIAAFFLMGMVIYLFTRSSTFDPFVRLVEKSAPNPFIRRNARRIATLLIITMLVAFLVILSGVGRDQESIWNAIRNILGDEAQLSRLKYILENILVACALLFLLTFFPILNTMFSRVYRTIDRWRTTRLQVIKIQNLELLTPTSSLIC